MLTFIPFWGLERQSMSRAGAERETQNLKQAPGSELSAQSLMWGWNSQTMRSCPEPKSDAQPTEPPRCPFLFYFILFYFILFYFILFYERETEQVWPRERGKGREREREKERERERILSRMYAQHQAGHGVCPSEPGIMTWAKIKTQRLNQLSHPGAPSIIPDNMLEWLYPNSSTEHIEYHSS